ncbi:MAG: toxin-antitoxin system HicB family antitoxin [Anaerolineaceae bacterium]|nr:toxin-antitoxin system HicB family antitoxin [Anaerolineaceae bacterium]
MKQLTIRGVDEKLHETLQNKANQQGLSLNRYVLHLIKESVGLAASSLPEQEFDDLDDLAGTWTEAEYTEFANNLDAQRKIDAEMWS